jgi:UDP-N-acetylmuramoylalanine--D-glutamate ligase
VIWSDKNVTVAGLGTSGVSAARALARRGAAVTVVDGGDGARQRETAAALEAEGATLSPGTIFVRLGDGTTLPKGTDLVVTSPGWKPDSPLFAAAAEAGVEVVGDVEIAWRLRDPGAAPWLAVTGTNGKTTTVQMLASILRAAGLRTAAVGNIGTPIIDVVQSEEPYDVLAVELSSYQLHWAPSVRPYSAAVLNLAPDHLDWHGSMDAYAVDKGRIYQGNRVACVYNAADPATERLVHAADVEEGCRAVGFTLGTPGPSQLGVVEGLLVDRAFITPDEAREVTGVVGAAAAASISSGSSGAEETGERGRQEELVRYRYRNARELAEVSDIRPPAPHNIANALAAAALARAFGVEHAAVREGLRAFRPDAHRIAHVADIDGVAYVDDSKATNTHATEASLASFEHIVWIAGGLAKGATFDDLVRTSAQRLRGAVLIGADRALIRDALARHAPQVPVVDLDRTDTGAMAAAVREATRLARPGDTVLLAPACASMDMFTNYGKRGEAFAEAVQELRTVRGLVDDRGDRGGQAQ